MLSPDKPRPWMPASRTVALAASPPPSLPRPPQFLLKAARAAAAEASLQASVGGGGQDFAGPRPTRGSPARACACTSPHEVAAVCRSPSRSSPSPRWRGPLSPGRASAARTAASPPRAATSTVGADARFPSDEELGAADAPAALLAVDGVDGPVERALLAESSQVRPLDTLASSGARMQPQRQVPAEPAPAGATVPRPVPAAPPRTSAGATAGATRNPLSPTPRQVAIAKPSAPTAPSVRRPAPTIPPAAALPSPRRVIAAMQLGGVSAAAARPAVSSRPASRAVVRPPSSAAGALRTGASVPARPSSATLPAVAARRITLSHGEAASKDVEGPSSALDSHGGAAPSGRRVAPTASPGQTSSRPSTAPASSLRPVRSRNTGGLAQAMSRAAPGRAASPAFVTANRPRAASARRVLPATGERDPSALLGACSSSSDRNAAAASVAASASAAVKLQPTQHQTAERLVRPASGTLAGPGRTAAGTVVPASTRLLAPSGSGAAVGAHPGAHRSTAPSTPSRRTGAAARTPLGAGGGKLAPSASPASAYSRRSGGSHYSERLYPQPTSPGLLSPTTRFVQKLLRVMHTDTLPAP